MYLEVFRYGGATKMTGERIRTSRQEEEEQDGLFVFMRVLFCPLYKGYHNEYVLSCLVLSCARPRERGRDRRPAREALFMFKKGFIP